MQLKLTYLGSLSIMALGLSAFIITGASAQENALPSFNPVKAENVNYPQQKDTTGKEAEEIAGPLEQILESRKPDGIKS